MWNKIIVKMKSVILQFFYFEKINNLNNFINLYEKQLIIDSAIHFINFFFQFLSEYRTTGQTKSFHFSLLSLYPFSQSSNFKGKVFFL